MDPFNGGGGYHAQQPLMSIGGGSQQGLGVGHSHSHHGSGRLPAGLHQTNALGEVYGGGQNGMYALQGGVGVGTAAAAAAVLQGQGTFGPSHHHLSGGPLHGLQPQSIDGYVLQGSSVHGQGGGPGPGLSPSHAHGPGFGGVSSFGNVSGFGGGGSLNDPYQRSSFGYGM
jgi:hypothetical protein